MRVHLALRTAALRLEGDTSDVGDILMTLLPRSCVVAVTWVNAEDEDSATDRVHVVEASAAGRKQ
jgi:hypothetical protein